MGCFLIVDCNQAVPAVIVVQYPTDVWKSNSQTGENGDTKLRDAKFCVREASQVGEKRRHYFRCWILNILY